MLNVFLIVMKIVLYILLGVVSLALIALALVLFVPVRYHISGSNRDIAQLRVKFSWLFRFISLLIWYEDGKLSYYVRMMGLCVFDSRRVKTKKKKHTKRKKHKHVKTEKPLETNSSTQSLKQSQEVVQRIEQDAKENGSKRMKTKMRQILKAIQSLPKKLKLIINRMRAICSKVLDLLKKIRRYPNQWKAFIRDEENRSGIGIILRAIQQMLQHAKPKTIVGEVVFGFEDPCTTGQVLGVVSIVYTFLDLREFRIVPEFEQAIFKGWVMLKGRIRVVTVTKILLQMLRDEHFKSLKIKVRKFKEEL